MFRFAVTSAYNELQTQNSESFLDIWPQDADHQDFQLYIASGCQQDINGRPFGIFLRLPFDQGCNLILGHSHVKQRLDGRGLDINEKLIHR